MRWREECLRHDLGPVEMRERRGRRGFEAELDDRGEEREDRREKGGGLRW